MTSHVVSRRDSRRTIPWKAAAEVFGTSDEAAATPGAWGPLGATGGHWGPLGATGGCDSDAVVTLVTLSGAMLALCRQNQ